MKGADMILGVCVVVICLGLLAGLNNKENMEKEILISLEGEVIERIAFGTEQVLELEHHVIVSTSEGVFVEEADCPDHDCVKMKMISEVGRQIICAPHRLVVEIIGVEAAIDAIS